MVILPTGLPAAGKTGTVYADAAGTVLADILAYQPGTPLVPGAPLAGSQVTTDVYGMLPLFWWPNGVDRLWITVNNGPLIPIDVDYNVRLDALEAGGGTGVLNPNLVTIAGLITTTGNVIQSVGSAWASQTPVQLKTSLVLVKGDVGLGNIDNTADTAKPVSTAQQTALNLKSDTSAVNTALGLKADVASPTFTGTVGGITKAMVGLGSVDNTADTAKPVSTIQQAALDAKQPLDSDLTAIAGLTATTGNVIQSVAGAWAAQTPAQVKTSLVLVKADVGLGNVDNTSDVNKPVSTAQAAADALKANTASPTFTGTATAPRLILPPVAVTFNATLPTDASLGSQFRTVATAAFTLANPTNPVDGQRIVWEITQDATGSRVMTLGAVWALGTDITAVTLSTAPNITDFIGAIYNATAVKWRIIAFVKGY